MSFLNNRKKDIIFFSNNKNKIIEINNLFKGVPFNLLDLKSFRKISSPLESGLTFKENAKIKAQFGLKKFKKICFADDSGISIDSLSGKPSVNSKGFLEGNNNQNKILNKIIISAKEKDNFDAFFQTTICLSLNLKKNVYFNGIVKGTISKKISGLNGFGYDPIFIPSGHDRTFAEMKTEEKNLLSHRGIAFNKLKKYLKSLI